jgi:uncharacterized membrane protein YedE/YeeE
LNTDASLLEKWNGLLNAPEAKEAHAAHLDRLVIAGLLVGFGTRLANGCTSGHGICGIARLSPRSIAATVVFMVAAIIVVALTHHVIGG